MTPFSPPRRTTTGPLAAPPASCVTVTPPVLCPESVTLRMASAHASLGSLGASVIAVTTLLLRSPPTAVKVGFLGRIGSLLTVCQELALQEATHEAGSGLGMLEEGRGAWREPLTGDPVFFSAVNYDSCPRAIEAGIWWPRTRFGLPAAAPCPKGSFGRF